MPNLPTPPKNTEATMTLKEITDLLEVRHNDAMKTVAKMAESEGFGAITKISYMLEIGNGAKRNIQTYQLNRRQSMAVSARLNTTLLMKVIDRLDELENKLANHGYAIPQTYSEALALASEQAKQIEMQQKSIEQKDKYIVASNEASVKAGEILVREFAKSLDFVKVGQNKIYEWLREAGYIMESREPYQRFVTIGYFTWKPSEEKYGGKVRYTLRITPRGKVKLAAKYLEYLEGGY